MNHDYRLMCDKGRHIVLFVEDVKGHTAFISKDKKEVGLHRMPSDKFQEVYNLEYVDYPLDDYAKRTLALQEYGVTFAPMAFRHLNAILTKEPLMAKPTAPVSTKAAPVADPKSKAKEVEPKTKKAVATDEAERPARERREKLDGSKKIKVIGKNPARLGTTRHAIVETIFSAKTVAQALDSTVSRKDGTDYKVGTPDIYFALESNLIELV